MSELKVKALIRLIEHGKIIVEDIKDENYRTEVESRL
jgi:hypothetical protein